MKKSKDRDKILRATWEKQQITYKGTAIRLSANVSTETVEAKRKWHDTFKDEMKEHYNHEYSAQNDSSSYFLVKSKAFQRSNS